MFWPWLKKQKNKYPENIYQHGFCRRRLRLVGGGGGGGKKQKRNIEVRIIQFMYRFKYSHSSHPKDYEWPIDLDGKQSHACTPK